MPLPPKPDEDSGLRTSPPPPYYPTRPLPPPRVPQPRVPAPRVHGYVNATATASSYFQPLSDDEARLVQSTEAADNPAFEEENAYLDGRPDDGEAIELRDLGAAAVIEAEDLSAQNDHPDATTVYAIRRQAPSNLVT